MTDTLWHTDPQRPGRTYTTLVTAGAAETIHVRNAWICNNHASNGGWISFLMTGGNSWIYVPPGQSVKVPLDCDDCTHPGICGEADQRRAVLERAHEHLRDPDEWE